MAEVFIVSTSYEHYIKALCKAINFPYKNTYCTKVSLDKCAITPQEKDILKKIAQEITQMHLIDIPKDARNTNDFSETDQAVIGRLDEIFWSQIPKMFVGKFLKAVVIVGGEQKAEAIRDAVERLGAELADVMYVGDSITDVEAFKLVRENGGFTVSFNGNGYAVKNAEVAVLSESNLTTAILADLFFKFGKEKALGALQAWSIEGLKKSGVDKVLLGLLSSLYLGRLPNAETVTAQNVESLVQDSSEFRKKVRGVAVGGLG
jgi:energy-converting hydrogenase A subunit R